MAPRREFGSGETGTALILQMDVVARQVRMAAWGRRDSGWGWRGEGSEHFAGILCAASGRFGEPRGRLFFAIRADGSNNGRKAEPKMHMGGASPETRRTGEPEIRFCAA